MQGVSHLGERRTMLHDGVERFLFPFIRPSRYSRRAPPRRRIGEKRKKRRKIFSPRRKSKITVLFFEQHRRGRTSSQAYSKSWCKLSKSRAHTHTHTQVWENNRKRWSLCVCTIHTLPPRSTLFVKWHRWLAIEYCDISMLCIGFSPISPSTPLFFLSFMRDFYAANKTDKILRFRFCCSVKPCLKPFSFHELCNGSNGCRNYSNTV